MGQRAHYGSWAHSWFLAMYGRYWSMRSTAGGQFHRDAVCVFMLCCEVMLVSYMRISILAPTKVFLLLIKFFLCSVFEAIKSTVNYVLKVLFIRIILSFSLDY